MEGSLKKLQDVVHLGKLATDFLPGLLLIAALLLAVQQWTDLNVIPYAESESLEQKTNRAREELKQAERVRDGLRTALAELSEVEAQKTLADTEVRYLEIQLASGIKDLQKQPTDESIRVQFQKVYDETKSRFLKVVKARTQMLVTITKTKSRHEDNEKNLQSIASQIETAEKNARDVRTLTKNLSVLEEHIWSMGLVGLILGILFAQISGGVFYNGVFWNNLKANHTADVIDVLNAAPTARGGGKGTDYYRAFIKDEAFLKGLPDLGELYRYLEIAMNSVLPLAVVSGVSLLCAITEWDKNGLSGSVFALALLGLLASVGVYFLYKNARENHVGYFLAKARNHLAILDQYELENP